jgi:hypothetical protein
MFYINIPKLVKVKTNILYSSIEAVGVDYNVLDCNI